MLRKRIRLIHRYKKRSRKWNRKQWDNIPASAVDNSPIPTSEGPIIDAPDTTLNTEVHGEIIAEKENYRLVKFDEEDYHCMERKQDGRYISHRSFENLRQATFHFDNEHD